MSVNVSGEALIGLPSGARVPLGASDIRFEHIATLASNPPELTHEAVWLAGADEKGPGVAWMVWEAPKGVLNDSATEPFNGAKIISDFEFEIGPDSEDQK